MIAGSALARLFHGYLHQDYDLRYPDVAAALRAYRIETPSPERHRLQAEIESLLAAHPDDDGLYRALRARGFIFYPPREGESTRDWLLRARALLDVEDSEEERDR